MKNQNKTATTMKESTTPKAETVTTEEKPIPAMPAAPRYTVQTVTIAQLENLVKALPPMQTVRGSVWPAERAEKLVDDYLAGLFIPLLVLGGVKMDDKGRIPEKARLLLLDGQQRALALLAAYHAGKIDGAAPVNVAVDVGRTAEECFSVLNSGVKVPLALVRAQGYTSTTRAAVLSIAATIKATPGLGWTKTQTGNSQYVSLSAMALAICAGWADPESSAARCAAWLEANGDKVTPEVIDHTTAAVNAIMAAFGIINGEGVKGPIRAASTNIRRVNTWGTIVGYVTSQKDTADYPAAALRSLRALGDSVAKNHKSNVDGEGERCMMDYLTGGSNGGMKDYKARLQLLRDMCEYIGTPAYKAAVKAAEAKEKAGAVSEKKQTAAEIGAGAALAQSMKV